MDDSVEWEGELTSQDCWGWCLGYNKTILGIYKFLIWEFSLLILGPKWNEICNVDMRLYGLIVREYVKNDFGYMVKFYVLLCRWSIFLITYAPRLIKTMFSKYIYPFNTYTAHYCFAYIECSYFGNRSFPFKTHNLYLIATFNMLNACVKMVDHKINPLNNIYHPQT